MNKKAYHPSGRIIYFNDFDHSYTDDQGTSYTSVTSFISDFFPSFNADEISKKCACGENPKYSGRKPEDIQSEWAAEGGRGRSEGTNVHEYAEALFNGDNLLPEPISERCADLFIEVDKAYNTLSHYNTVGVETIVFSPQYKLAGTIDLLLSLKNIISIDDWKQNKRISFSNYFQYGKPPLDHLQDTDLNHYTLQLSLYQYILETENYFPGCEYERNIYHLKEEKSERVPIEYYKYEIEEMLSCRMKNMKLKS